MGIKKGASALWYSELNLHQLGSRPTVFVPRWTAHPCILNQVCPTRGAGCCCCCSGKAPRAQLLKKSAWLLHLIGGIARDSSEVARPLNRRGYPHTGNGGHSWCLSSSVFLSIGFSSRGCCPVRATGGSLPRGR